ncbi:ubiquitin-like domain-containing protein [Phanerochaete sordida]|uniref:Ubiquitin-like domain-containing protein n=1 Tax=Phanerochaete sordida TaxID=48140 RepID=A0A9P3G619_9APHY|nr:ubiquitin-like domain-containing protein [Phanerochaete sordida]
MSTRPAPRPRPRPRPRAVTNDPPASSSPTEPTAPLPKPLEPVSINVNTEDEDALFFKNRNRNTQVWMKMRKLAEENESKKPKPISDDDSDAAAPATPKRKQKQKHSAQGDADSLPAWTKSEDAIDISSSDEEDEILRRINNETTPTGKRVAREEGSKRANKKQRSRSRSVTPPPALPSSAFQHARETIRRIYGVTPRAPSPTGAGDDSLDTIELDPELAIIARSAKIDVQRQLSSTPAVGVAGSRSPSPVRVAGPETAIIRVQWVYHPLNREYQGKRIVYEYKMRRTDSFREMFDETADSAGVLVDHLIITYEGKRIFPSASPHGIGVWDEATLEGYDRATYDYIRAHPRTTPAPDQDDDDDEEIRAQSEALSDAGSDDDEDKMKLIFRSTVAKPITLTVRPTTKCSTILKAFLKQAGLSDKYPASPVKKGRKGKNAASTGPALVVDGDRLDPDSAISAADLEDGDLVEVVGL